MQSHDTARAMVAAPPLTPAVQALAPVTATSPRRLGDVPAAMTPGGRRRLLLRLREMERVATGSTAKTDRELAEALTPRERQALADFTRDRQAACQDRMDVSLVRPVERELTLAPDVLVAVTEARRRLNLPHRETDHARD